MYYKGRVVIVAVLLLSILTLLSAGGAESSIDKKYKQKKGILGPPVHPEGGIGVYPDRETCFKHYKNGTIYYHPVHGTWEIHGPIEDKYNRMGKQRSWLGHLRSDQKKSQDEVLYNVFEHGYIVYTKQKGAYAIGYGSNADKTDAFVDFTKLTSTDYGNFKEFHNFVKNQYGIDLREAVIRKGGRKVKNIRGWQFPNFRTTKKLNGFELKEGERFIFTVAQALLMQWHLKDLNNNGSARRSQINKYCKGGFKKGLYNNKWRYPKWCSEFASWAYRRSGLQIDSDWCVKDVEEFVKHFKKKGRYYKLKDLDLSKPSARPRCGDYIHEKGHSILVLGMKDSNTIYIINGNIWVGSGKPQENKIYFGTRLLSDTKLIGIGRRGCTF